MKDKIIYIAGKEIDYGSMSNEKLLNLYNQLLIRQKNLMSKAKKNGSNIKYEI